MFGGSVSVRHSSWTANSTLISWFCVVGLSWLRQQPSFHLAMYSAPSAPKSVGITNALLGPPKKPAGAQSLTRSISSSSVRSCTSFQKPSELPRFVMNHEPS